MDLWVDTLSDLETNLYLCETEGESDEIEETVESVVAAQRKAWLWARCVCASQVNGSAIHKIVIVLLPRVWYVYVFTIGVESMDWVFDEKKYYTIPCWVADAAAAAATWCLGLCASYSWFLYYYIIIIFFLLFLFFSTFLFVFVIYIYSWAMTSYTM